MAFILVSIFFISRLLGATVHRHSPRSELKFVGLPGYPATLVLRDCSAAHVKMRRSKTFENLKNLITIICKSTLAPS